MNQGLFWCIMAAGLAAVILAIDGCLELAKRRERRLESPKIIRFDGLYLGWDVAVPNSERTMILSPETSTDTGMAPASAVTLESLAEQKRRIIASFGIPPERLGSEPRGSSARILEAMTEWRRPLETERLEREVKEAHRLYRGNRATPAEPCLVCGEPEWRHTGAEV